MKTAPAVRAVVPHLAIVAALGALAVATAPLSGCGGGNQQARAQPRAGDARQGGAEDDARVVPRHRSRRPDRHRRGQSAHRRRAAEGVVRRGPDRERRRNAVHDRPAPVRGRAPSGRGRNWSRTRRCSRRRTPTSSATASSSSRTSSPSRTTTRRWRTPRPCGPPSPTDQATIDNARLQVAYCTITLADRGPHRQPQRQGGQPDQGGRRRRS